MQNKLQLHHWHVEPSSICTLKCPRCPRAEVPGSLLNKQLSLSFFQTQIGAETVLGMKKITFCGNDGDPIYCKELTDICAWLKSVNSTLSIVIVTNGSHKPTTWWRELGNILDEHDELHWSLDGWDHDSNILYRVNSNWQSITDGIEAFTGVNDSTYLVWDTIGFRFNQDHIEKQQALAKEWRFDLFQLTKSTKFGSKYPESYGEDDHLEPTDTNLVSSGHRFERTLTLLTSRVRPGRQLKTVFLVKAAELIESNQYSGICLIGNKGVFLNSRGEFYPCCWTANRYDHNKMWAALGKDSFNLYRRTFTEVINDPFWSTTFLKFDSMECTTKCTKSKLHDVSHVAEW